MHRTARFLWVLLLAASFGGPAHGTPIADGRFDPGEGYTTEIPILLDIERGPTGVAGASLWQAVDANGDVSIALILPLALVDNTYGANSIGWASSAPSGKHHNLKDLMRSDKAQFVFTDAAGSVVLDFVLDYFSGGLPGWGSGGVVAGDGEIFTGSASSVLEFGTSLDYNFDALGHSSFTLDSPATDADYSDPSSAAGWIFDVVYEVKVDGSVFGPAGFGALNLPVIHASPNKLGKNKLFPRVVSTPEPSTLALVGMGLAATATWRRRRPGGSSRRRPVSSGNSNRSIGS